MNILFARIAELGRRLRYPFPDTEKRCLLCRKTLDVNHRLLDGYIFCKTILHQGTRSEGSIGRLMYNGKRFVGKTIGEEIYLNDGKNSITLIWRGDERPYLWSHSGWEEKF